MHGVALKPGKPICLGAVGLDAGGDPAGVPDLGHLHLPRVRRPGDPAPRRARAEARETLDRAGCPSRFNSEIGRTEYLLVNLVHGPDGPGRLPAGQGLGLGDDLQPGRRVRRHPPRRRNTSRRARRSTVVPLGRGTAPADLVASARTASGSTSCSASWTSRASPSKTLWVGSQGGLIAAGRGECDLAGVHLLDPATDTYNRPFLPAGVRLLPGYGRMQGIVFRPGDPRFEGRTVAEAIAPALDDPGCVMVNRNRGSGTRVLIDRLLGGRKPPGYAVEARSHNAVAAAVAQGRADWGLAIAPVARRTASASSPSGSSGTTSPSPKPAGTAPPSRRSGTSSIARRSSSRWPSWDS